jgi:hypothetical protein
VVKNPDPCNHGSVVKNPDSCNHGTVVKNPDPCNHGTVVKNPDPCNHGTVVKNPDPCNHNKVVRTIEWTVFVLIELTIEQELRDIPVLVLQCVRTQVTVNGVTRLSALSMGTVCSYMIRICMVLLEPDIGSVPGRLCRF